MLIEPMNGEIILSRNYSPQSIQSNSDQLSQLIESLPDKHYVFISCDNESGTRLNDRFKNTISKHLSNRSLVQTLENGSYCTIGQINRAEQQRSLFIENFTNDTDSTICSVRIPLGHLYHEIKGNSFSVNANQNSSTITLNGKSIIGKNEILSCDGLNVVVLEPNTREPKHFQYDVISHQTLWTEFNRMITTLPIGTVVAIAIQKSRGPFPSDQSIAIDREIAFNLIGSCQFTSLDENESFALIGYKGTSPGCALEQKSLSSAAVASMEPPQDEVVYETKSTDKTLFNVPLFQGLQKLMKPVSTLEIENATGHVYGIEPAYSFKSVTIPRNLGVGVKRALIVGMSYNYSAAGRYRDADYIARQHAQALVSCGYIDSADSIKIMTETNTQTNMTPTYTNISNQITTWLQSTSNSGDSIYLAFIGRGFTTVFNKSDEDNFQGGYTFLANDGKTLQFVIYSNFQALFNSIPSTVNRSVLVDSSYSTEIALPNNYSPSNYVNNTNIISSLSFNQKPFISQQSCGFVEALNIIMAEQNRAGLPLLTYDNIITKLTNNPLYIGGQLPQLFASTPYKIFLA
ncbi:hypothetical protein CYY_001522 [Polysphondylium violaceum]|nr:hypothetical protein CYY_001522 [Polysphondylium violaceum]